jgi:hypothetical protein
VTIHRLETKVAALREELQINGARMQRIDPHRRPKYTPVERMAILELRAMRGWSKVETARHFFVSDDTVRAWLIAVVERFHRTLKELLRLITIPVVQERFELELGLIIGWYNEHRPHETLGGNTPNEVYFSRPAANERPRCEPRPRWPPGSPCASPQVGIKGNPGDPFILEIGCLENRRHLPIICARRAA